MDVILFAITVIFPLIMAFIPAKTDLFKPSVVRPGKKRITVAGIAVVIMGILAGAAAVCLGVENHNDMRSLHSDLDTLKAQDSAHSHSDSLVGVAFDPKAGKVIVIDSNLLKNLIYRAQPAPKPVEEKPEIVLSPTISSNPTFYYVRDSSWAFIIALEAKNGIATILKDRCIAVEENNGGLVYSGGTWKTSGNPTTRLTSSPIAFQYGGPIRTGAAPYLSADTGFVFIRIEFANDNGKPQKPFERMYYEDKNYRNKTLREAHSDEFENVKKYLVSIHKW
jgi:hypothetical protein